MTTIPDRLPDRHRARCRSGGRCTTGSLRKGGQPGPDRRLRPSAARPLADLLGLDRFPRSFLSLAPSRRRTREIAGRTPVPSRSIVGAIDDRAGRRAAGARHAELWYWFHRPAVSGHSPRSTSGWTTFGARDGSAVPGARAARAGGDRARRPPRRRPPAARPRVRRGRRPARSRRRHPARRHRAPRPRDLYGVAGPVAEERRALWERVGVADDELSHGAGRGRSAARDGSRAGPPRGWARGAGGAITLAQLRDVARTCRSREAWPSSRTRRSLRWPRAVRSVVPARRVHLGLAEWCRASSCCGASARGRASVPRRPRRRWGANRVVRHRAKWVPGRGASAADYRTRSARKARRSVGSRRFHGMQSSGRRWPGAASP